MPATTAPQFAKTKRAILDIITTGHPLTTWRVLMSLRDIGHRRSISTVRKALAQMTAAGTLVNDGDGDGYRLPPPPLPADLQQVKCLARQFAAAAVAAVWGLPVDRIDLAEDLNNLAIAAEVVAKRIV